MYLIGKPYNLYKKYLLTLVMVTWLYGLIVLEADLLGSFRISGVSAIRQ
jgi:hypothetical protein